MRRKVNLALSATLFAAVAVAHLTRIVVGWEISALWAWGFVLASRDPEG